MLRINPTFEQMMMMQLPTNRNTQCQNSSIINGGTFHPTEAVANMIVDRHEDHVHELNFELEEQQPLFCNVKLMAREEIDASRFMPRNRDCTSLLPQEWKPSPTTVVIGRGKVCSTAKGNARLESVCKTYLDKYKKAKSKVEKTALVSMIVETIQEKCPVGAFVKYSQGRYWEVEDHSAREKVGYVMRDLLHDKYKSSSKSKTARRKSKKEQEQMEDDLMVPSSQRIPSTAGSRNFLGPRDDNPFTHQVMTNFRAANPDFNFDGVLCGGQGCASADSTTGVGQQFLPLSSQSCLEDLQRPSFNNIELLPQRPTNVCDGAAAAHTFNHAPVSREMNIMAAASILHGAAQAQSIPQQHNPEMMLHPIVTAGLHLSPHAQESSVGRSILPHRHEGIQPHFTPDIATTLQLERQRSRCASSTVAQTESRHLFHPRDGGTLSEFHLPAHGVFQDLSTQPTQDHHRLDMDPSISAPIIPQQTHSMGGTQGSYPSVAEAAMGVNTTSDLGDASKRRIARGSTERRRSKLLFLNQGDKKNTVGEALKGDDHQSDEKLPEDYWVIFDHASDDEEGGVRR